MAVTYVRNQETGQFEMVGPGGATTDPTLSLEGRPADAAAVGAALANYATEAYVSSQVNTKVDAVDGKSLSTNDYTNADKNFVAALKYADLGSFSGKTITDLKTALANWIASVHAIPGARAIFRAGNHVTLWNNNDATTTISAGAAWTVEIKTYYGYSEYALLEMCNYTDQWVYYVVWSNETWGKLRNVAFDVDLPTTATSSKAGLVKIGSNITNSSGTISLSKSNVTSALGYTPFDSAGVLSLAHGGTGQTKAWTNGTVSSLNSTTVTSSQFAIFPYLNKAFIRLNILTPRAIGADDAEFVALPSTISTAHTALSCYNEIGYDIHCGISSVEGKGVYIMNCGTSSMPAGTRLYIAGWYSI